MSVDGRDSRWTRHRSGRRDEVLTRAVELIDANGGGVSVAAIAAASDTPRSVVYRLFDGREELDEHIRRRIVDDLMATLVPAVQIRGSVRSSTRTAVETYVGWVIAHPKLHAFLGLGSASRPSAGSQTLADAKTVIGEDLASLIGSVIPDSGESAQVSSAALDLAFALVGAVDNVVNHWVVRTRDHGDAARVVEFLTDSCCALIEATARGLDLAVDVDRAPPF